MLVSIAWISTNQTNKPKQKKTRNQKKKQPLSPDNNVTTAFGSEANSFNGPVSIATIYGPYGISIHPITQEVYIAEFYGGNIRGWNRTSQTVRTVVSLGLSPLFLDFQNDGTLFITTSIGLIQLFTNGLFVWFINCFIPPPPIISNFGGNKI